MGPGKGRASSADHPDRRLIGGLLVSLLLHGLVLLLQFGVPGLGVPGAPPPPLTVRLAPAPTPPAPTPLPEAESTPAPAPAPPTPLTGMQVVDAVPAPPPPPPKAVVVVKQGPPHRAKRIRSLLPPRETLVEPPRIIAQDATKNDFVVPLARPEESEQKTIDPKEAQHGDDDGDAAANAALEAAAAKAGALKAEAEAKAAKLAQEAREAEQRAAELAQQKKAEEERRVAAEQIKSEQQQLEQKKAEQLLVERQRTDQLKQEQQKIEQARLEQQKIEQAKLEQQKVEQARLEQQKVEQAKLAQQKLEQAKLEQQKAEQAKLAQQKAEQAKLAQQQADQQRAAERAAAERAVAERAVAERAAADQRGKELAAGQPVAGGQGAAPSGAGAGANGTVPIPKNMLGSDLGNRARDLVKGLDVLRGAPPPARRPGERRAVVGINERDLPLKMYVESWRQKIERNGALNYPRSWADAVRNDPLVSVAVRSDGSVEDVIILNSSGRADVDEAVRRIVRVNARYSAFPPQIAERYDVIDIRRVWHFDETLKLMEELH